MSLNDSIEQLKNFDPSDLDFETIGIWPLPIRILVCVGAAVLLLALFFYLHVANLNSELATAESKEQELRGTFEQRAFEAANLDAYRKQMKEVEGLFGALLAQLPSDTEVPGLLEDVTDVGAGASLNIGSITLQPERSSEFYVELPIKIVAKGGYHDIGAFVSGVASLPRIVTLHDYQLKSDGAGDLLSMEIQAKTYRYKGQEGEE